MDTNWTPVVATNIYNTAKWRRIREVVLLRDSYTCQIHLPNICGRRATMVDHVVPIAEGGEPFHESNLRAACGPCNSRLGGRLGNLRKALATDGHGVMSCPTCGGPMAINKTSVNKSPTPERRLGRAAIGVAKPY
jgi:hypothetical protein